MTFIKDSEAVVTGLNLVLKRSPNLISPITSLVSWLSDFQPTPVWIPLKTQDGVIKIMPVLPDLVLYPNLMEQICQRIGNDSYLEWQQQPYEMIGVEVNTKTLHIINISLIATASVPSSLGRAIHAQCFEWFANTDPTLAQHLHQQENVPFTLGIRYITPKKMQLKITLFKQELLAPLLWGLYTNLGSEIMLAGVPCRLGKSIDIFSSSFKELAQLPAQNSIELKFLSPTSFKRGGNVQPFPLPELVFGSLWRRWNTFAPQELKFPAVEWNAQVSAFEMKTYALKLEVGAEIGAEGWVRYRFSNSEQAKIATVLANFACFAGVGRKTAMGMGQVKIKN